MGAKISPYCVILYQIVFKKRGAICFIEKINTKIPYPPWVLAA